MKRIVITRLFLVLHEHFIAELYAGTGIAYRNIQASNVVNPVEEGYGGVFVPDYNCLTGQYLAFSPTVGVKVAYRF